jgi:IS4 transposase
VSASYEDEKKFFGPLLRQAAQLYHILSIAGDKNYLSKVNIKIAEELGCKPYLYPKKNYKADPRKSPAWNSNLERHREGTEEDAKRIRQRRQIETTFSMIKLRLSAELNSKKIEALINEALCLVICHNLRVRIFNREMYGTEVVFPPDDGCEAPLTAEPSTTSEPEPTGSRPDGGGL